MDILTSMKAGIQYSSDPVSYAFYIGSLLVIFFLLYKYYPQYAATAARLFFRKVANDGANGNLDGKKVVDDALQAASEAVSGAK